MSRHVSQCAYYIVVDNITAKTTTDVGIGVPMLRLDPMLSNPCPADKARTTQDTSTMAWYT